MNRLLLGIILSFVPIHNKTFWIPGDYDTHEYLYNTTRLSEINALAAAAKEKDIAVQAHIGPNAVQKPLMMKTPAKTPWRTILISDKATTILVSKTILNLNEPCQITNTDWNPAL
jgi:glucan 1,4-alpha-glucosidase